MIEKKVLMLIVDKNDKIDSIKLARTLWNKPGKKYSKKQMKKFGFKLK